MYKLRGSATVRSVWLVWEFNFFFWLLSKARKILVRHRTFVIIPFLKRFNRFCFICWSLHYQFRFILGLLLSQCERTVLLSRLIFLKVRRKHIVFLSHFATFFRGLKINGNIFILIIAFWWVFCIKNILRLLGIRTKDVLRLNYFNFPLYRALLIYHHVKDFIFYFICYAFLFWCVVISFYREKIKIHLFCDFISDFELFKQ